jgi:hypothetical protein
VISVVTDFFWCVVGFLQTYNGAVTAVATVFIGAFTWVLACVTGRQARLTRRSIDLAREEFIATHRPKVILHTIEFRRIPGDDAVDRIGASILCFNKGTTVAKRVEVRGTIIAGANIVVDVPRPVIKVFENVLSGQKLWFEVKSEWPIREIVPRQQSNLGSFHCVGTIVYFDQSETRRETGYCFVIPTVVAGGERWERAKGNEYNYAY